MRRLMLALLPILLMACAPQLELEPTPRPPNQARVIVASEGGRLPTKPVPATPSPTPTTDLVALINTVVPFPTRTPGPALGPTPTLRPPLTSTPRPLPARIGGSLPRRPTTTPAPLPTRAPPERTAVDPEELQLTREARITPSPEPLEPDALEPNDTSEDAVPLEIGQEHRDLTLHTPDDVDVFAVPVEEPNVTLVVSLSGRQPGRYKLDIAAPRGGNVGRQRLDGTVALRSVAEVGAELGTYHVYVRRVGVLPPEGPYSIAASLVAPTATPTVP
ncbi:MAG TPA: hypothetical protein VG370_10765 [Chloroflexota bacterium]|nr:hypothetical protein [Chloroflexota bacterium]